MFCLLSCLTGGRLVGWLGSRVTQFGPVACFVVCFVVYCWLQFMRRNLMIDEIAEACMFESSFRVVLNFDVETLTKHPSNTSHLLLLTTASVLQRRKDIVSK